jgi:hypothetical protein
VCCTFCALLLAWQTPSDLLYAVTGEKLLTGANLNRLLLWITLDVRSGVSEISVLQVLYGFNERKKILIDLIPLILS